MEQDFEQFARDIRDEAMEHFSQTMEALSQHGMVPDSEEYFKEHGCSQPGCPISCFMWSFSSVPDTVYTSILQSCDDIESVPEPDSFTWHNWVRGAVSDSALYWLNEILPPDFYPEVPRHFMDRFREDGWDLWYPPTILPSDQHLWEGGGEPPIIYAEHNNERIDWRGK